jgi:hypothetical protein
MKYTIYDLSDNRLKNGVYLRKLLYSTVSLTLLSQIQIQKYFGEFEVIRKKPLGCKKQEPRERYLKKKAKIKTPTRLSL